MTFMDSTAEPPGDPLDAVRRVLLSKPHLQHALGGIVEPEAFSEALLAVARAEGVACDGDAVAGLFRPDPLGINRWAPAPVQPAGWPGRGWLPSRSAMAGDAPAFDWAWQGNHPLDRPFYEDSMRQAGHRPLSQLLRARTGLGQIIAGWRAEADPVVPAGFIFHLSRCGSTLLARMMQTLPGCYAASEPEPFDAVVQWAWRTPVAQHEKVEALRAMAAAIGRDPASPGDRFFIKLDCWHTLSLPLLRSAFPETPWLFLYRDPVEVAVSQLDRPGVHVVPGMIGSDMIGIEDGEAMTPGEYCARVLGRILGAARDHVATGGGMLVNYAQLRDAMTGTIAGHFSIPTDREARARIAAISTRHAKAPDQAFTGDSEAKRAAAPPELVEHVDRWAMPAYRELESLRMARNGCVDDRGIQM